MAEEVAHAHTQADESLLDDPARTQRRVGFSEHVRTHDALISPVLRFIKRHVEGGLDDADWYEDQLYFLLSRMQSLHTRDRAATTRVPAVRPGTRQEIFRRLSLCTDFIHTNHRQPIGLAEIAAAAHLSPYHCLRLFRSAHGCTPVAYLRRRRLLAAERLLRDRDVSVSEVAARAGIESRTTLFRQLRASRGASPSTVRACLLRQRRD
jgi:AraC family transcriptional regulator